MDPPPSLLSTTHPMLVETRSIKLRRAKRRRMVAAQLSRWIPLTMGAQRSCRRSSSMTPTGPWNTGLGWHHQP
eukprot:5962896-Prymnesium_polylepis.1